MKKKLLSLALIAGVLATGVFAGCGAKEEQGAQAPAASESTGNQVIKIAASPTPHAEILAKAKDILAGQGYDLQITEFEDYVQPNEVVESGEFDANYFQHIPYLDSFNEEKGTHIVNAGGIHYEPFGIYAGTKSSLDDLAEGDSIAVPNDTTNEARTFAMIDAKRSPATCCFSYPSTISPSAKMMAILSLDEGFTDRKSTRLNSSHS